MFTKSIFDFKYFRTNTRTFKFVILLTNSNLKHYQQTKCFYIKLVTLSDGYESSKPLVLITLHSIL